MTDIKNPWDGGGPIREESTIAELRIQHNRTDVRVAELERELDDLLDVLKSEQANAGMYKTEVDRLQADLAVAVDALEPIAAVECPLRELARKALAKLKDKG